MNTTDATGRSEGEASAQWVPRSAHLSAACSWLLSLVLFRHPLSDLVSVSFHDERSSHILLIPFISAFLIFLHRKRIFHAPRYCPSVGIPLLLIALTLWYGLRTPLVGQLDAADRLSLEASLIVIVWIAFFILYYGSETFRSAAFPLLFLALMIPIPAAVGERIVSLLQRGSAEACDVLFRLIGVPFIRHGFLFSLPGVDIEVAEQCSGIHSAVSLSIVGLLLQYLLLESAWKKIFFTLCIFPIAIFKNAVRIVTIAWLGIHVNPAFFYGQLHRQGGLPFSLLAIAMLGLLLLMLKRSARGPFPADDASAGRLHSGLA